MKESEVRFTTKFLIVVAMILCSGLLPITGGRAEAKTRALQIGIRI